MPLQALITPFPWARYSRKLASKIEKPRSIGFFTIEEAQARDVHLAIGRSGQLQDGNLVVLFWLVDKEDGIIIDARFQAFGQSALVGAAEVASEIVIGKNYDQAKRISAVLMDQYVRDRSDQPSFPKETGPHMNLILEAIEVAAEQCEGLPLASNYVSTPIVMEGIEVREGGYPGWKELSQAQKLAIIEEVLNQDIRPYIALDAGGVEVIGLADDRELTIRYQGSCTSCYSSMGTTLTYIQQVLRAKVHPDLQVTPDFS